MSALRDKRVLVTGASGFIGSALVRRLLGDGAEVHALTSAVSSVYPVRLAELRDRIVLHEGNLGDRGAMDVLATTARPDYVFHLGAYTHVGKSWQRVDECVHTNVQGTVNLLQALAPVGYTRFVYTGTSEIYGDVPVPFVEDGPVNPVSPYSVSKYAGERYCRMFVQGRGWPIVMVRPFNAFGPRQTPDRVIPEIIVRALRGQPLRMTKGLQTREFNYVDDLAAGFVAAAVTPGVEGQLFNLGGGQEISMRDLATTLLDLLGNPVVPEFGALPERPTEIWRMHCDSSRARAVLGWAPEVDLEEGLRRTIAWYEEELTRSESSSFLSP
ncbi:MAG: SDR family NAD(P)-dependent oxidoreductase [Streptomyces sp.]|uniref:NAD-dependent epimerase/dehydratase family protein n=1 Tax=Streptomyces sp. TaxID=1931 RepID=UPI0025D90D10|nr:NAD-dependent epimerase/dehydratase family protein [Streptomyces sp.]MBW8801355.1 SDR family NAD(P)-dependent oxidoreductase [Streptomyces sp.]